VNKPWLYTKGYVKGDENGNFLKVHLFEQANLFVDEERFCPISGESGFKKCEIEPGSQCGPRDLERSQKIKNLKGS